MILWRIRGEIIRTVLFCAVHDSCAQRYAFNEQFLKLSVGLRLCLGYSFVRLLRFSILCVFWFSLDYFVLVLLPHSVNCGRFCFWRRQSVPVFFVCV